MTPTLSEIDVLVPQPKLWRVADVELRQVPLKNRQVLKVIQFVEKNYGVLDKFRGLGKPEEEGGKLLSTVVQEDVFTTLNALVRLLFPSQEAQFTDDWCLDFLTPAHYVAFIKTALIQNQLYEVFTKAKELMGQKMAAHLRQSMTEPQTKD